MLFSSIPFLYRFLPVVLLCYAAAPRKLKNAVLLGASLIFYAWGEQALVLLFALTILTGWGIGILTERAKSSAMRKLWLCTAAVLDLGLLGWFKYSDFFIQNLNALTGSLLPLPRVTLPIGISFYIFQLLSYNIDVYRGTVPAQKNPVNFGTYVAMFPQLIAGPVVRYADIREQLSERSHSSTMTASGIRRFLGGLGKKILIANALGELCRDFRLYGTGSILFHWLYAIGFTLQIYYDFSGYSDMAIGLGRIFGFSFPENFNHPYISASITEFWRRWHISLGSWFRDYVYIPLGGSRAGRLRQLLNILIVWMLTGLWHGAAWNFVVWGLMYASLLMLEKLCLKQRLDRHPGIGRMYTMLFVTLGFVIFNAEGMRGAAADLAGLFAFGKLPVFDSESLYALRSFGPTLAAGMLGATTLPQALLRKAEKHPAALILEPAALAVLLLLCTAYLADGSFNPFLYFRF